MAGKFITFEGGEGAGKSTQIVLLAERLDRQGVSVTVTREPGGTPRAEAVRDLILSGRAARFGPEGEALLFSAARADHVAEVIAPALASGGWVLCDRFIDSTLVYQGGPGGVATSELERLARLAIGDTRPDLTIILDLPVETGLARASARGGQTGAQPDRFEQEGERIHDDRRQAFLEIARQEPQRCVVIDASATEAEVAEGIWNAVIDRLPGTTD
jgi:dTMP kinase